jgi:NADH-quinone oxidoreductase subunit M
MGILYKRYKTRIIQYYQGLAQVYPIMAGGLILGVLGNIAMPFTLGFISEFKILEGVFKKNENTLILLLIGILFGGISMVYFLVRILYGPISPMILEKGYKDLTKTEI